MMKQQLSEFMDGELGDAETCALLGKMKQEDFRDEWHLMHLIGDVMRQPDHLPRQFGHDFRDRLEAEPVVFAPVAVKSRRLQYFAMSAVASIMAMAFLAWFAMRVDSGAEIRQFQLAGQPAAQIQRAINQPGESINDYLVAHHEYSPNTDLRGASSYLQTVSLRH